MVLSYVSTTFPWDLVDCLHILSPCGCLCFCRKSLLILSLVSSRGYLCLFVFLSALRDCSLYEIRWHGVQRLFLQLSPFSAVFHVYGEINSDLQVFVHPIVSIADSIIVVLMSSMVKAVSSRKMLMRLLSVMLNISLTNASFSIEMSGRLFLAIQIIAFLSFYVIIAKGKLWSPPPSALLITRIYWREKLHLLLMIYIHMTYAVMHRWCQSLGNCEQA